MSRPASLNLGKYHAIFIGAFFAIAILFALAGVILPRGLRGLLGLLTVPSAAWLALRWFVNDHGRGVDARERWQLVLVGTLVMGGLLVIGSGVQAAINPWISPTKLVIVPVFGTAMTFVGQWLVYGLVNLLYPEASGPAISTTGAATVARSVPVARQRVLVVGEGAAAHALAWKLGQSSRVLDVLVAPGNAGTASGARCRNVAVAMDDVDGLVALIQREDVALTIVPGSNDALVQRLRSLRLPVLGATASAHALASDPAAIAEFARRHALVPAEAGDAGSDVVLIVLGDGLVAPVIASVESVTAADTSLVSPAPSLPAPLQARAARELVAPIVLGLSREQAGYAGFLQVRVRVAADGGLRLAGLRAGLGDDVAPAWMLRQQSDLAELLHAAAGRALDQVALRINPRIAAAQALTAGNTAMGALVTGLDVRPPMGVQVFHGATRVHADGTLVAGPNVLSVCALGDSRGEAARLAAETLAELSCRPRTAAAVA